ncbi:hypothetical protein ABFS82_05G129200 [Erythranthe guttata]|uniref:Peptidase C1A papain C-terminal domain-containing protein n=1 Tax=Erythranthe guttata TaxID=4155 RepID=A0A022QNS0_ERYGU|nr:PREDICTED: cysteine proteinase-like [Erythranthe guttata]XP_012847258.1 PREDICTED: cysteine proteinase-like [Erythranthe guttata]EYU29249.1 hypothetical protein MIMGU_mgv1a015416mg [Erythranthe guttata]|eukprot:XP_012847257.1 PREDICTED: cysteine proteinase-like [Erythranthe guttata]
MTFYDCDAIAPLSYVQRYGVCLASDHPYLLGAFDRNAQSPIVSEKIKVRKIVLLGGSHIEAKKAIDRGHPFIGGITVFPDLGTFEGKGIYRNKLKNKNKNWARHAVLVVGYGVTFSGEEYYIVQNSWGDDWGDNGLGKISCELIDPQVFVDEAYVEMS